MEQKLSYRFLNTSEGQKEAHNKYDELEGEGLKPTFCMGVKWIIVQTDYVAEEKWNDKRRVTESISN